MLIETIPSSVGTLGLHHETYEFQPPNSETEQDLVVCVRRACKHYGLSRNPLIVLDGLNMTVCKGTIYGLLGASGCGKTTLLSCILGQRKLNSGQIWVLGGPPGTNGSGVPGPRVGYMPQQVALYGDFTIRETLMYFGWIAGIDSDRIEERFQKFAKLFMLPETSQRVKTLSGGEQRRVSLATALFYEPELLILDEPTVGVDPLLRENIWEHLVHICKEEKTTVIITTHYIEEARQAHIVGLMRGGEILAEESPEKLLAHYGTQTLEEVFLKLSISQNVARQRSRSKNDINSHSVTVIDTESVNSLSSSSSFTSKSVATFSMPQKAANDKGFRSSSFWKGNHMKALIWKNMLLWIRNIPSLLFLTALAVLLMTTFCVTVGPEPHDLLLAVVNHETNNVFNCDRTLTCNGSQLSCTYLENLKKHSLILTYYNSEEEAKESVVRGKTLATVIVGHNYSEALRARIHKWHDSTPWDVTYSNIHVTLDASNNPIEHFLKVRLYDTFQDFIQDYFETCGMNPKTLNIPVKMETPVYGTKYPNFTDFAMPGAILTIIFMLAILLTASAMLIERTESSLERSFVLGITEMEILAAHIVSDVFVMIIQSLLIIITAFAIFDMTQRGSFTLIAVLTISMGFCGMCYGLFISCICNTFFGMNTFAMGTVFPIFLMSGVVWPIEGMHRLLQPFIIVFPLTKPIEGMRSILQKNWDLSNEVVYMGFVSVSIWTVLFLIGSIVLLKFKKT